MSDGRNISFKRIIYLITLLGCFSPTISRAQEITHVDFTVTGSTVKITYDITSCSGSEDYDIKLMLGHKNELSEIKRGLSGDLAHVACGSSNLIVWDVPSDREELKGPIFFTVEISRTHPIVTDESPIAYETDDGRPEGAVPYGDPMAANTPSNIPRQGGYAAPLGFFKFASWIIFEQARAAVLSHGRPQVIFQKRPGPALPVPKRHR